MIQSDACTTNYMRVAIFQILQSNLENTRLFDLIVTHASLPRLFPGGWPLHKSGFRGSLGLSLQIPRQCNYNLSAVYKSRYQHACRSMLDTELTWATTNVRSVEAPSCSSPNSGYATNPPRSVYITLHYSIRCRLTC